MATKRPHDGSADEPPKKKNIRTGFRVGPENLPDGTYRRKVKKIKTSLIKKAKIKREFAKIKAHHDQDDISRPKPPQEESNAPIEEPASLELHPDRQAMLDNDEPEPEPALFRQRNTQRNTQRDTERGRWAKTNPFSKEADLAQKKQAEIEKRQQEYKEAEAQRRQKIQDRQRLQKAMAKARQPGKNGQRKLGRESVVLLEKVKKLVNA
ncbi:hypothetical protein BT63DRAFT_460464 [Microthyrium microscopicum]|uniref:rRNA-processing protein FYV7 n=1 Tax=Microthyrium microscopicum TaxID=703497 RepID=A0A6A6TXV0_9PEZI|nr:hypothetical protein BT63DRAFT_460464 [Microthyrium microscopicum]